MTKNEMIIEAQQVLPVLPSAEIEEYWGMLDYVEDEPEPEGFVPTKAEMIDIIAWRLCQCTRSQVKIYLAEIKQAAETQLKRRHDIMQAMSNAGLPNVRTDVSMPAGKDTWFDNLALIFADRYGCLANKVDLSGDHNEDDSCGERQCEETICFYGSPVFAAACAQNFTKAHIFAEETCRKIVEDAKESSVCEEEIEAMCDAYGCGFCNGVRETFTTQWRNEMKQGLYLAVPQAIRDYKDLIEEEGCDFIMCPDLSAGKYGAFYRVGVRDGRASALSGN